MLNWESLTNEEKNVLFARQDEREISSVEHGIKNFRSECARQPMSQWTAGRTLMAEALDGVVHEVEVSRNMLSSGRGMRGAAGWAVPYLTMDPGVLALTAVSTVLDRVHPSHRGEMEQGQHAASIIAAIGGRVEMEYHMMLIRTEAPRLKAVMDRHVKQWGSRSIATARSRMGLLSQRWSEKDKRHVGAKLIAALIEGTDLFEMQTIRRSRTKTVKLVKLTESAMERVSKLNEDLEIAHPVYLPMVVPPTEWGPDQRGGFRLLNAYYDMVIRKSQERVSDEHHGPKVYDAINRLQKTEWQVNGHVLKVMQQVWQAGGGWAGIPAVENLQVQEPFPKGGRQEDITAWKHKASLIHRDNARMVGRRMSLMRTLSAAEDLKDDVFYFPYRYDFRGRVYPLAQHLQPQANDIGRGLLTFARSRRLTERGFWWLKVQYANCWGVDKVSFDDRVKWAEERLNDIMAELGVGCEVPDMLDIRPLWAEADDPWQCLATLHEILSAWTHPEGPEHYPSHLPVSMDGSNSGLQHFSAMLRDAHAGGLVNLVPGEKPNDIYSVVADAVIEKVKADAKSGLGANTSIPDLPAQWLKHGINRKLTKRPTMTYNYSVTLQGMKEALIADGFLSWTDSPLPAVKYIAKVIWDSIEDNVECAAQAMEWLKACAKCANRTNTLLTWTTPDGFKVTTPYLMDRSVRVTCLNCEIAFREPLDYHEVSTHRQRNSIAPNFVHSYDGTHLRMSLNHGYDVYGIWDWMMVHDQFGTHACAVDSMLVSVKQSMVDLYTDDQLARLRKQTIKQTGEDPGPPPEYGGLVLEDILESDYIFS